MSLKTLTLLAAITQLMTSLCLIVNYIRFVPRMKWAENPEFIVTQPFFGLSHIMLAIFLFVLSARQKKD